MEIHAAIDRAARFRRIVAWSIVLAPVAIVLASFVVQGWQARRFLAFYIAPLAGAFASWLWLRLGEARGTNPIAILLLDLGVVALAGLRFMTGVVPVSGHMLFLVYSALTQKTTGYRVLATVLILETTYFKLGLWDDPTTWAAGALLGAAAAVTHRSIGSIRRPDQQQHGRPT